uniref:HMG box domain-containing protein n=1 Tax=Heterosigma akashiwo TaxID=2829 RepID=A0A7S3XMG7_HETAK
MFMAEKRPDLKAEGLALGQIQKKGAALWKEMREQEKQAYQKIADNANVELGLLSSKDESSLGKTMAGASKKSPSKRTAYQCFMSTLRPQFVAQGKSFGETTKLIAAQWKKLAQDEKQKYQDLADEYNNNGSTQKNDGSNSSALPQQGQPDGDSSTIGAPKNNDGKVLSVSR